MAANILRKRLGAFLMVLILGVTFATTYVAHAADDKTDKAKRSKLDRRHEQIGTWSCAGTTTAPYGTERPYYGVLKNEWTQDGAWLLVHFEERQPVTEVPLIEDQYWGYNETSNKHTRTLMVNDGSHALVHSSGWQKETLPWSGTFTTGEVSYSYQETIERLSANRYRWHGSISQEGTPLLNYDMTCTRD